MMALYDKEKVWDGLVWRYLVLLAASPTSKTDTKALSGDFFLFSADGAAFLGFYTDSQNPSIFPQPYQIPIKKTLSAKQFIIFSPSCVYFHSSTPSLIHTCVVTGK